MDLGTARQVKSFVGWLLAFLLLAAGSAFLFFGHNDALAQSDAIDSGTAQTQTARLDARLDKNERHSASARRKRNGADEWTATCDTDGPGVVRGTLDVPGKGEILKDHDGDTVTCYVWDGKVIGVKLPDGTVVKSEKIGWRGTIARYNAAFFALGAALLIGGAKLRMGFWTAFAGGVLAAAALVVALHVALPWVALAVDVVLVVGVGWYVVRRRGRGTPETDEDSDDDPAVSLQD